MSTKRSPEATPKVSLCSALTPLQLKAFQYMTTGHTVLSTSLNMGLSPKTVGKHWSVACKKLRVSSICEATHYALHHGLIANVYSSDTSKGSKPR